ncbi:hypothetical protein BT63DRAFT_40441 [Microthyrium microscopicum]|uniref:Yeast cell wall synthesis Kre9/Knh1-like N-terminal domain-containing protein n=1 Tax=Microthyrium microscopicum TaxID=703497 RepID=A0A6A6UVP2_9PEZI|nr:hypothetical protein BT63DRAFT_40441 [Microthyrium microscopicum]
MFSKSIVSALLFASQAFAAISFTSTPSAVVAGQTYTLTWVTDGTGPVTILLKEGISTNLATVGTLTTTGAGGSFTWTAPSTYAPGTDYAFEIDQEGEAVNYSGQFPFTGGVAVSSSVAPMSSSAAASASGSMSMTAPVSSASSASAAMVSSVSGMPSGYKNSTVTSTAGASTLKPSASLKPTATPTPAPANSAASLGSPVALVLSVVAAMLYLQ